HVPESTYPQPERITDAKGIGRKRCIFFVEQGLNVRTNRVASKTRQGFAEVEQQRRHLGPEGLLGGVEVFRDRSFAHRHELPGGFELAPIAATFVAQDGIGIHSDCYGPSTVESRLDVSYSALFAAFIAMSL